MDVYEFIDVTLGLLMAWHRQVLGHLQEQRQYCACEWHLADGARASADTEMTKFGSCDCKGLVLEVLINAPYGFIMWSNKQAITELFLAIVQSYVIG